MKGKSNSNPNLDLLQYETPKLANSGLKFIPLFKSTQVSSSYTDPLTDNSTRNAKNKGSYVAEGPAAINSVASSSTDANGGLSRRSSFTKIQQFFSGIANSERRKSSISEISSTITTISESMSTTENPTILSAESLNTKPPSSGSATVKRQIMDTLANGKLQLRPRSISEGTKVTELSSNFINQSGQLGQALLTLKNLSIASMEPVDDITQTKPSRVLNFKPTLEEPKITDFPNDAQNYNQYDIQNENNEKRSSLTYKTKQLFIAATHLDKNNTLPRASHHAKRSRSNSASPNTSLKEMSQASQASLSLTEASLTDSEQQHHSRASSVGNANISDLTEEIPLEHHQSHVKKVHKSGPRIFKGNSPQAASPQSTRLAKGGASIASGTMQLRSSIPLPSQVPPPNTTDSVDSLDTTSSTPKESDLKDENQENSPNLLTQSFRRRSVVVATALFNKIKSAQSPNGSGSYDDEEYGIGEIESRKILEVTTNDSSPLSLDNLADLPTEIASPTQSRRRSSSFHGITKFRLRESRKERSEKPAEQLNGLLLQAIPRATLLALKYDNASFSIVIKDKELFAEFIKLIAADFTSENASFWADYVQLVTETIIGMYGDAVGKEVLQDISILDPIAILAATNASNNSFSTNTNTISIPIIKEQVRPQFHDELSDLDDNYSEYYSPAPNVFTSITFNPYKLQKLYDTYIKRGGNHELNLSAALIAKVKQEIEDVRVDGKCFEWVAQQVLELMYRNQFPAFLKIISTYLQLGTAT